MNKIIRIRIIKSNKKKHQSVPTGLMPVLSLRQQSPPEKAMEVML